MASRRHIAYLLTGLAIASGVVAGARAQAATECDLRVAPAGFGTAVQAAAAGQTICLADGDYGTWTGTDKAITVTAQPDASPQMRIDFDAGAAGFTLSGMTQMGGRIGPDAHDLTIRDSAFTGPLDVEATNAGIVLDHNSHDWNAVYDGGVNAKIFVWNETGSFSGVTIENSTIRNGDLDGVHTGGGAGVDVLGNTFSRLCDLGTNHTDNIQLEGAAGGRIAGNYISAGLDCPTQGITSFDGGTHGVVIEDNVVDIRRPWGIELYSDQNSIVRHNTLLWYAKTACTFDVTCGRITVDHKPEDPPGAGTQIYDNLTTSTDFANGSTGVAHDNVNGQRAVFVGPLDTYAGYRLAPDSPVGLGAASDGADSGARIPVVDPTPTPTPTDTPTPTATATAAPTTTPAAGSPLPAATAQPGTTPTESAVAGPTSAAPLLDLGFDGADAVAVHGARHFAAGRHGRALAFDGRDSVSVAAPAGLRSAAGLTLEAWVRPAAARRAWRGVIAGRRRDGTTFGLYADDGRGRAAARAGRVIARTHIRPLPGHWTQLAATYDGRTLRVYVNGRLARATALRGPLAPAAAALRIGQGFVGRIDDVRVWGSAVSAATLRAHAAG